MKKKIIYLLVAIILVGGMIGALAWQRGQEPEPVEEAPPPATTINLIQTSEAELQRVTFSDSEQHNTSVMVPFTDENFNRQWRWEGADYVLNTVNTRNKIRGMFALTANQVVHEDINEAGINLADFGLYPPYMTITAEYGDGTTKNVYLGSPTIDLMGRFVMVEGSTGLYTVNRAIADRFLMGLEDMIDVSLPVWSTEAITQVVIAQRDQDIIDFRLEEHHEFLGNYWLVMQEPFPGREVYSSSFEYHVFEDFAMFMLGDLVSFHPTNLAPYGLDYPSLEFIYRAHHGEAHLLFGDIFFREVNGHEVAFIYVKFADRPHVFETFYDFARPLFDVNVLRFIDRFISLVMIHDVEWIEVTTPDGDFDLQIGHIEDSSDIIPTINGTFILDSDFRLLYRMLIGLGIDAEIAPFTPTAPPLYTITHHLLEDDNIVLHFYHYSDSFLAVSVDGDDIWFVTNRRNFDMFTSRLYELS